MARKAKVQVDITMEEREALRSLAKLTKGAKEAGNKGARAFGKMDVAVGSLIGTLGSRAVSAFFSSLNQGLQMAFQNLRDFSRGIGEVNTLLPKNQKLTEQTKQEFLALSAAFGVDAADQVKAYYQIVSAGAKNARDVLIVANKAAIGGVTDTATAADILTTSLNAFATQGLTAKDAADSLFTAVRLGKTTFEELAQFMGDVAPIVAGLNLKFDEMNATLAFLTKQGIRTDKAVTGLKAVLTTFAKQAPDTVKAAKEMGIDFSTAALAGNGLAKTLREIAIKTGGSTEKLAKLFPNVRALIPILSTVKGDFEEFNRIIEQFADKTDAADMAYQDVAKSLDKSTDRMTQTFSSFATLVGRTWAPVLTESFRIVTEVFVKNAPTIIRVITRISSVFLNAVNGIAAVVGTIRDLFVLVFEGIMTFIQGVIMIIGKGLGKIGDLIVKFGFDSLKPAGKALQDFRDSSKEVYDDQVKDVKKAGQAVADFSDVFAFDDAITEMENLGESAATNFAKIRQSALDAAGVGGGSTGGEEGGEEGGPKGPTLQERIQEIVGEFQFFGMELSSLFGEITDKNLMKFKEFVERLKAFSKQIKSTLMSGVAGGAGQAFAAFGKAVAAGQNPIDAFIHSMLQSMGQMAIQLGTMFIAEGIAMSFAGLPNGPALIGAGAALAAVGGAMSVAFAGGAPGGQGAGGAAGDVGSASQFQSPLGEDTTAFDEEQIERDERTQVNLTINGDVFDSDETGIRVANILEDVTDKGLIVRSAGGAVG